MIAPQPTADIVVNTEQFVIPPKTFTDVSLQLAR
jgi:hypothetical protein